MSDYHEHLELMNIRLRVMEVHLADIRQTLMDIRDAVLILGGRSPAQTPEDASRARHPSGGTEVWTDPALWRDDPVLHVAEGPEQEYGPPDAPISARTSERVIQMVNCAHKWPDIELTSFVECERCGLPYGQWSVGENR